MIGTLNIDGVDYVVIPRAEYEGGLPKLPLADARGERPAKAAALAGVRAETISRIESGRYRPQRATMLRIDQAIASAEPRSSRRAHAGRHSR